VAADAYGNVYVADNGHSLVKMIPAGNGTPVTLGSGFSNPFTVSVDGSGNVFVADYGNKLVKEIPINGGAITTLGSGYSFIFGTAVDKFNNVYVTDYGHNAVKKIQPTGGYYINPALPKGLNFNNTTGTISGTPVAASPATNYLVTAYNQYGGNSITINITVTAVTMSYASPQTYVVSNTITPLSPTGTAAAPPNYSTSTTTLGSGFNIPAGIAVDAAGNVYIGDQNNNAVKKIPGGTGTPITIATGFSTPDGIAIDAAGNIFVADDGNNLVKEVPYSNGVYGAPVVLASGFSFLQPFDVAVDSKGNVYVADRGNNAVEEITPGSTTATPIGSGFSTPTGVTVDAYGNVYVADNGHSLVKEIPAGNGTPVTLGSGFSSPFTVAVDGSGNVFVADYGNKQVKEIPINGGAIKTVGSGYSFIFGVTTDAVNNVYVTDYGNNAVKKIQPVGGYYINPELPKGLSFNNTTGTISGTPLVPAPATNYTITAYNQYGGNSFNENITVTADANLSNLTTNAGAIKPAFNSSTISYGIPVANTVTTMTVTPTSHDPAATITVNGKTVASGSASTNIPLIVGANTITTIATASDGVTNKTYTLIATRAASGNDDLSALSIAHVAISPTFLSHTTSYTATVAHAMSTIVVTATAAEPNATITINGITTASGTGSSPIALNVGSNTITIAVTAQNGANILDYTIDVTRKASTDDALTSLELKPFESLTKVAGPDFADYTVSVPNNISSISVIAVTSDPTASITVNGTAATSGVTSSPVTLAVGNTVITTKVTAQDGVTSRKYVITLTRAPSSNAILSKLSTAPVETLTSVAGPGYKNYTSSVPNSVTQIKIFPVTEDPTATVKVNGTTVASGSGSAGIHLAVGPNTITTVVTAQDGTTMNSYIITMTRAAGPINIPDDAVAVAMPSGPTLADDGLVVRPAVSPNGDGVNDVLTIDNIANYPDNKLMIMNRNGAMVFEAKGYDNQNKVFDGHSNKTGQMQQPGTYFYSLEYTDKGILKHKTGFIVLKY